MDCRLLPPSRSTSWVSPQAHGGPVPLVPPALSPAPPERPRFLSEADYQAILRFLTQEAQGGGDVAIRLVSLWTGYTHWARNQVTGSGEDRDNDLWVRRYTHGGDFDAGYVTVNDVSPAALVAADRRAERLEQFGYGVKDFAVDKRTDSPFRWQNEPEANPQLFSDTTYHLDSGRRAEVARQMIQSAAEAGVLSAGYLEVSATSYGLLTSYGYEKYYQYTWAQCSLTVRDPKGRGSGWAGIDWPDWSKVDAPTLAARALEKCLKSRTPVAVEPGRYTTILEPQAVGDFIGKFLDRRGWERRNTNEDNKDAPFFKKKAPFAEAGFAELGERILDERLTISTDPMDPELGFPPHGKGLLGYSMFTPMNINVYHAATWIKNGVLLQLPYDRDYGIGQLGLATGLPYEDLVGGPLRIDVSGPTQTVEEMIASTKRGLLVTRFDNVIDVGSTTGFEYRGYTRDGLWLIENGKISKACNNLMFVEDILFALNNLEQVGTPQRVFNPLPSLKLARTVQNPAPLFVPALKIKDFSFTALSDAI